jgi:hypothetical protein
MFVSEKQVIAVPGLKSIGPYSQAVRGGGGIPFKPVKSPNPWKSG